MFLKRVAVLLVGVMIYESCALPLAQASSAQPASISDINTFQVSSEWGETVETSVSKTKPTIYHIQDIHTHIPSQINLSGIISDMQSFAADQNKSLLVLVEGGAGDIESNSISALPNKERTKDIAAGLLKAGHIFGEEYAAVTHAPGEIKLFGVESERLYEKNTRAKEMSEKYSPSVLKAVQEIHAQLRKLNRHNFNLALTHLEQYRHEVEAGERSVVDYVKYLSQINPALVQKYPSIVNVLNLKDLEEILDLDQVKIEQNILIQELSQSDDGKQVKNLLLQAQEFKNGHLSPVSFYSSLLLGAERQDYPAIENYVAYLKASHEANPDQIFTDLTALELEIAKAQLKHPMAMELYSHLRWIERQEKFFSLQMIPQEWHAQKNTDVPEIYEKHAAIRNFVAEQVLDLGYQFQTPIFSKNELRVAVNSARDFYESAEARDTVMVRNLKKALNIYSPNNHVVALIAGGFHSDGIVSQLKKNGFGYQIIRPHMETEVQLTSTHQFLRAAPGLSGPARDTLMSSEPRPPFLKKLDQRYGPISGRTHDITSVVGIFIEVLKELWPAVAASFVALSAMLSDPNGDDDSEAVVDSSTIPENMDNLSNEELARVREIGARLDLSEADQFYLAGNLWQAKYPQDNNVRLVEGPKKPFDPKTGSNFRLTSDFGGDQELYAQMGVIQYGDIASRNYPEAAAQLKETGVVTIDAMEAGLGENFTRYDYVNGRLKLKLKDPNAERKISAKGTDLEFYGVEITKTHPDGTTETVTEDLRLAELKLLQIILEARRGNVSKIIFQPLVNDQSVIAYQQLLQDEFIEDQYDERTPVNRTYQQVLDELGIEVKFHFQAKLPGIKEVSGGQSVSARRLPTNTEFEAGVPSQPGGHGQFGVTFLFEALELARKATDRIFNNFRVFFNGDNLNSRVDPKVIEHMKANNHVVYLLAVEAGPIDVKGGKFGLRADFSNSETTPDLVPDIIELAQAKSAKQADYFTEAGLKENDDKALFNTNIQVHNTDLLGFILADIAEALAQDSNLNDEFRRDFELAKLLSPTRIDKPAKEGFLPVDGAIASVVLNLNAFYTTSQNPKIIEIREKYKGDFGIERLVHIVNVPRLEFFTPEKFPTDHLLLALSSRFYVDGKTFALVDKKPGQNLPRIEIREDVNPKASTAKWEDDAGAWADLATLEDNLGGFNSDDLESLEIFGPPLKLKDFKYVGNVRVKNYLEHGHLNPFVQTYVAERQIRDLNEPKLIRYENGQFVIENAEVIISGNGKIVAVPYSDYNYPIPSQISPRGLGIFGISLILLGSGFDSSLIFNTGIFSFVSAVIAKLVMTYDSSETGEVETLQSINQFNRDYDGFLVRWVLRLENAVKSISPLQFTLQVQKNIFADSVHGTIGIGAGLLNNSNVLTRPIRAALILLAFSHEVGHQLLPEPHEAGLLGQFLIEPAAYVLGLVLIPFVVLAALLTGNSQPKRENDYLTAALQSARLSPTKLARAIGSQIKKLAAPTVKNPNAKGTSFPVLALSELGLSNPDDIIAYLENTVQVYSGVNDYVSTFLSGERVAKLLIVNDLVQLTDGGAQFEERVSALVNQLSSSQAGIEVTFADFKSVAADYYREGDLANAFKAAGIPDDISSKPESVYVLSQSGVGFKQFRNGVQINDNFIHLAMTLVTYSRFINPTSTMESFVQFFEDVLGIPLTNSVSDNIAIQILAALQA